MRLLSLFFIVWGFPGIAFSANYGPVPEQNQPGQAAISHRLYNHNLLSSNNTYLSSEPISLSFDINVAASDVGHASALYLVALYKDKLYMKVQTGEWVIWDADPATLQPFEYKILSHQETIHVISNHHLPAGEFMVAAGYSDVNNRIIHNQSAVSFLVFEENNNRLHKVTHPEFLKNYLSHGLISSGDNRYRYLAFDDFMAIESTAAAQSNSTNVSETNVQESGVDESDRLKTDGNTLFVLQNCTDKNAKCLNSYLMSETPASVLPIGQYELSKDGIIDGEIYLHKDLAAQQRKIIAINSNFTGSVWADWEMPYYWQNNLTELAFIDAAKADDMRLLSKLKIDGALISSRKIGDILYLVTRNSPAYEEIIPYDVQWDKTTEKDYMFQFSVDDFLPGIIVDDQPSKPLVQGSDCYVISQNSSRFYDANIINVTAVPINEPYNYKSTCIAGPVETIYASTEAIYLASNRYAYDISDNAIVYDQQVLSQTDIHKFSFKENTIDYKASGRVPGHLGWEADKRSFRMGEYNGVLKVATSLGDSWDNTATTRVAVLREDEETNSLQEVGSLDNLGKPGERLYAARFIGHRGFLVTFKVTDPLYVLDFTNPEAPSIAGELEISGYSDYIHPINENLLLGIGKDAIPDVNGDRGAWYQGVKVSLFDISNVSQLKEINSIVLGKRGTESTALYNHHAVSWLDDPVFQAGLLAIPVSLHETPSNDGYYFPGDPREYFNWTHTGLYVFDIDKAQPSLSLQGKLIVESPIGATSYGASIEHDRSVIQGESVHYIHNNEIFSSALSELK